METPTGRSPGVAAAAAGQAGRWLVRWLLGWLLALVGPPVVLALVAAFLAVALVMGIFAAGSRPEARSEARAAALAHSGDVRSHDGAERAHALPAGLVAVVALQARAEGLEVGMEEVARALAPAFEYAAYLLVSVQRVPLAGEAGVAAAGGGPDNSAAEPAWVEVRTAREVTALAVARTYRGTYRYQYRTGRVETKEGYEEVLLREDVTFTPDPERLPALLSAVLRRPVGAEEAGWLEELGLDLESGAPAPRRWLAE